MRLTIVLAAFVLSCGGNSIINRPTFDAGIVPDAGEIADAGIVSVDAGSPCPTLLPLSVTYPVGSSHVSLVGTYTGCVNPILAITSAIFYDATGNETRDVTTGSADCILTQMPPDKWQVDMVFNSADAKMVLAVVLNDGVAQNEQVYTFLLQ